METAELKRGVKEYRRLWEDAGLELSVHWKGAEERAASPAASTPAVDIKGNPSSDLCFVGEALSPAERALLDKIIEAMGRRPESVQIATFAAQGLGFSDFLARLAPAKVIVTLGAAATSKLLGGSAARGRFASLGKASVMPTLAPSALLANPSEKKTVWEDMKLVLQKLGAAS